MGSPKKIQALANWHQPVGVILRHQDSNLAKQRYFHHPKPLLRQAVIIKKNTGKRYISPVDYWFRR
jgi:hypothetical protein